MLGSPQTNRAWCQVPGCSRVAAHVYPVLYVSNGDGDEGENAVRLCSAHLRAIRRRWIRVSGRAPHGLRWELSVRENGPPYAEFEL